MNSNFRQNPIPGAAPGFFSLWGRRALVHISALLLMGCMSESIAVEKISDGFSIGIYLGLICIFHRGVWHEKNWFVPSLAGLGQTLLLSFLGMPLYACIFWGGVQSWLQRTIRNWGQMGSEWIVVPFLIMVTSDYFTAPQLPFTLWPLYTMLLVALAGYVTNVTYQRILRETIHKERLANALRRLQRCSESKRLVEDIRKQVCMILAQGSSIELANLQTTDMGRSVINDLDAASSTLEKQLNTPPMTRGGWSSELFSGKAWDKLTGKQNNPPLATAFRKCNLQIMEILRSGRDERASNVGTIDPLTVFEQQARQLMFKAEQAPEKITKEVEAIALLTFEIVQSMRDDPRDRPSGERFLQRYLPATEHIADEYNRLVSSNNMREDVSAAIRRAEEVLARLRNAFSEELAAMLANDSASFAAELNALDKLLKMSGH